MWQTRGAFRLGIWSVALLPLSVLGVRLAVWPYSMGFLMIGLAGLFGLSAFILALLFGFRASMLAQRTHLLVAALLGLSPVLLITIFVTSAASKPVLHDVSTDWANPPMFDELLAQRGETANPVVILPQVVQLQAEHYPDVKTIISPLDVEAATQRAVVVADGLGWQVVNSQPGFVEATYTSTMFGFVDDIVIRIDPLDGAGTAIDLRSVSRVGQSDLGANAARIMAFSEMF